MKAQGSKWFFVVVFFTKFFHLSSGFLIEIFYLIHSEFESGQEVLDNVVDNLDTTEDGEASEEPHGAADDSELALQGDLHVPLNLNEGTEGTKDILEPHLVKGGSVEEDVDDLKFKLVLHC